MRLLFSSATLWDSLRTPFAQHTAPYYDERGFSAQSGGRSRLISEGKMSRLFEESKAQYLRMHGNPGTDYFAIAGGGNSLEVIATLLAAAKERGVRLRLVVAPLHVQFQAGLRDKGLGPALLSWRRAVREQVAAHVARGGRIELHDFLEDPRNAEAVPDEAGKDMKYWSDGYHFSPAYGDEILAAVLAPATK